MILTKKRLLCLVISTIVGASLLTGCKTDPKPTTGAGNDIANKGPVTLKLIHNLNADINLQDNPVLKEIEKKANVKLEIEAPPQNNYWDRVRIIIASGDLPDFFYNGTDVDFEKWSGDGLLATLDDKIKKYPNLMANISTQQWSDTTALVDGKIHAVPRPNSYDKWGFLINNKWLNKLGLKAPTTVSEFIEVSRAFTKNDPDGNGKNDTYGVSFDKLWSLRPEFLTTAYNISAHWGMPDKDGTFHTRPTSSGYINMFTTLREMYKEGILDRDFVIHKGREDEEKMAQSRIGIIGISHKGVNGYLKKYNMNPDDFTFHAPLKLNSNGESVYMMPPSCWGAFLIPAASKKVDDVLKFLDWANTEEGFKLFQFGLQGTHYNSYDVEKRIVDRTPEQVTKLKTATSGNLAFATAFKQRPNIEGGETAAERAKYQKETSDAARVTTEYYVPFVKLLYKLSSEIPDQTKTLQTLEIRYITGEVSLEEFNKFITSEYKPKVEKAEKDYNEFMKKNPVEKKKSN
jgi:putative aldouronate transport system substrate-binding protein